MIRFQNGQPTGIYYSQHTSGEVCLWDDEACSSKQGDRVRDCWHEECRDTNCVSHSRWSTVHGDHTQITPRQGEFTLWFPSRTVSRTNH